MTKQPRDLALIDRARLALERARSVEDVLEVRDQATAVTHYLKRKAGAQEACRYAVEILLRAKRRIGEMLRDSVRHEGGRPPETVTTSYSLPDGVTRMDSSRWQALAAIPPEDWEEEVGRPGITEASLVRLGRENVRREEAEEGGTVSGCCTVEDLHDLVSQGRRYGTIYADPPWQYENQATRGSTDNHYGTLPLADIQALPVERLAADNAHCHLWTTNGFLLDAFTVLDSWGFTYKSLFVWVKPQIGMGNYWRVSHELMLFGVRGREPFRDRTLRSWMEAGRQRHSAKPEAVRLLIERASPGPRLELFGRSVVEGWDVWGNQVQRSLLVADRGSDVVA